MPKPSRAKAIASILACSLALLGSLLLDLKDVRAAEPVAGLEIAIARVRLLDPASAKPILEAAESKEEIGTVYYQFANSLRTETITFVQHPGAQRFSIASVEVDLGPPLPSVPEFPGSLSHFTSARGISLGMSPAAVKERLGTPTSESETELRYFHQSQPWLESFNFPTYESVYRFKQGRLVRFSFGFPYP